MAEPTSKDTSSKDKKKSRQINLTEKTNVSVSEQFAMWLYAQSCHNYPVNIVSTLVEKLRSLGWDGEEKSLEEFFHIKRGELRQFRASSGKICEELLPQHKNYDHNVFMKALKELQSNLGI